jgi:hypothetical protein
MVVNDLLQLNRNTRSSRIFENLRKKLRFAGVCWTGVCVLNPVAPIDLEISSITDLVGGGKLELKFGLLFGPFDWIGVVGVDPKLLNEDPFIDVDAWGKPGSPEKKFNIKISWEISRDIAVMKKPFSPWIRIV